jgi:hypothetical protein
MATASPSGHGDWVSMLAGVRISRAWMVRHTPDLLAAWCDAATADDRHAIAGRIVRIAAGLESEPEHDDDAATGPTWRQLVTRIDARLARGPDWLPLAAALARAAAAGYDVAARLPALAAADPLPARHPARELHWRLLDDCTAALPARGATDQRSSDAHSPVGPPQMSHNNPAADRGDASVDRTNP